MYTPKALMCLTSFAGRWSSNIEPEKKNMLSIYMHSWMNHNYTDNYYSEM